MITSTIIWIIAAVIFAAIEAATVALLTIWFALGAVAAAVASQIGLSPIWQVAIFVVVSGILLSATRPLLKKIIVKTPQRTNADRFIGLDGVVIKTIDKIESMGQVKVSGQIWSAVSEDGEKIDVGASVKIIRIEGVKLVVNANNIN